MSCSVLFGAVPAAWACDETLSAGANLGTAIAAAASGAELCLNDGAYNGINLTGVTKTSMVTVRSLNGAANVDVGELNFNDVAYVHVQGVTFKGGVLKGHHLQVTESVGARNVVNGVSQILKLYGVGANAEILIDRVRYLDIPNPCTNNACVEGRISILGGGNPSGITISNSLFSGGNSDGIQVSGNAGAVRIIGNEFTHLNAASGTHTDSIQLYGQGPGTVIQGNYFHDTEDGIMAGDGGEGEQILDNVFALTGYPYGIVMGNWVGSVIHHNTFVYGTSCSWNSCGTLWVRNCTKLSIRDNVIGELKVDSGDFTEDFDLIKVGGAAHGHTLIGLPTYVGGATPASYAGFGLSTASVGARSASDGTDLGIRVVPTLGPASPNNLRVTQ